jgi:hypothetical protein
MQPKIKVSRCVTSFENISRLVLLSKRLPYKVMYLLLMLSEHVYSKFYS